MDNLTHAMTGALIGVLWARRPRPDAPGETLSAGKAALLGAVIANLPDLDIVLALSNPASYLDHHRGLTHSLLLLPVWTLLVAALLKRWPGRESFARFAALAGGALLSHSLMDWIGSYGIFLFAPLSDHRYRLDWLFIIDLGFSGILAFGLLLTWLLRAARARTAAIALTFAALYACGGGLLHARALAHWRATLAARGITARRIAAVPQPFSPGHWMLLADDGETTRVARLRMGPEVSGFSPGWAADFVSGFLPADRLSLESFATALPARPEDPAALRSFMAFARFPTAWDEPGGSPGAPERLHWRDLQYGGDKRGTPFHLVAVLDGGGHPVKLMLFSRPGRGEERQFPVDHALSMAYWRTPVPAPALR
jgi:inner membrane protein